MEQKRQKELNSGGLEIPTQSPALNDYALNWLKERRDNGQPLSSFNQDEAGFGHIFYRSLDIDDLTRFQQMTGKAF
ncbi:MAG: hypothetical protein JNL11_15880 [Bdellovibrionaceae bacterium]|nr:hypothetical protein [Pseudobdellovibrionaceae bacterium]